MDNSITFAVAMAALNVVFVPVLKFIWNKCEANEALAVRALDELNKHKIATAEKYVALATFERFEERLFGELETIKNKLDQKADK